MQAAETNLGTHVDVVIYTSGGLYQIGKELLQNNIHRTPDKMLTLRECEIFGDSVGFLGTRDQLSDE